MNLSSLSHYPTGTRGVSQLLAPTLGLLAAYALLTADERLLTAGGLAAAILGLARLVVAARQRWSTVTVPRPALRRRRPTVSVIVPVRNASETIAPTVFSILDSDYPYVEVIVVDDGSTDGTAEVVERSFAGDPGVRLLHQGPLGTEAALARGTEAARGQVLVTLEAGVRIEADSLCRLLRETRNADARTTVLPGLRLLRG